MKTESAPMLLLALLPALAACGAKQPPPEPAPEQATASDPCDFTDRASRVWNPQVRARLSIPLKILQGNLEAQQAEMITTNLDLFTNDWITMRESACKAHFVEKTLSKADYDIKAACLDAALDVQRDVVTSIEAEDTSVLGEIPHLSDALERCTSERIPEGQTIRANPFAP